MNEYHYQLGGSLSSDAPSYVVRQADQEIYETLKAGKFCYVLNCRQIGKSSILVRTRYRLQVEGFKCAFLDMTRVGSNDITLEQWYYGIIVELWRSLDLFEQINLKNWLNEQENVSVVQKLSNFIEDIVLSKLPLDNIVIFIDEIDSILSLDFHVSDFFALIRFCYNQRSINPEYSNLIASTSSDGTIKLWKRNSENARTYTIYKTIKGHNAPVWGLSFSPKDDIIASASLDGTIKFWKMDGTIIKTIKGNKDIFSRIEFSPDGKILAAGTWQNTIKLWKRDGTLLKTLTGHDSTVWSVAFSPDGHYLISSSDDQKVILWNIKRILNLDFLQRSCSWAGDYLRTNAQVKQEDRRLCDGIK